MPELIDDTKARTVGVRIKVAPTMYARLEVLAGSYAMPVSTLAAFAISDWVCAQENRLKLSRMAVMDVSKRMAETFDGETMGKALAAALPAMAQALAGSDYEINPDAFTPVVDYVEASASE